MEGYTASRSWSHTMRRRCWWPCSPTWAMASWPSSATWETFSVSGRSKNATSPEKERNRRFSLYANNWTLLSHTFSFVSLLYSSKYWNVWGFFLYFKGFCPALSRFWEFLHQKFIHEDPGQLEQADMQRPRGQDGPGGATVPRLQLDLQVSGWKRTGDYQNIDNNNVVINYATTFSNIFFFFKYYFELLW